MVAGQSGLGKTTFLKTLFGENVAAPAEKFEGCETDFFRETEAITPYVFDMESEDGARILMEAIDTPGFNDDCPAGSRAKELLAYIEQAYDEIFEEEQRIHRNPKFEEHRIHALVYFIEPTGLGLKETDEIFLKTIEKRINIIPVIGKADGLTKREIDEFKGRIQEDLAAKDIAIFDFQKFGSMDNLSAISFPLAVIGSSFPASSKLGRKYPWGFVEVTDDANCDFNFFRQSLLQVFRDDLKETTEDSLYESYRTEKLISLNGKTCA